MGRPRRSRRSSARASSARRTPSSASSRPSTTATPAKAANTAKVVRRQLSAAWRGTKYYIKNAPPPPPAGDARVHVRDLAKHVRARVSGGAPAAGTIADAPTTTIAVFQLQDDVISTIVELTDGARVPLLDAVSTTLFYALDKRDVAVEDVHTLAPPPPPARG